MALEPYYRDSGIDLYLADCLALMPELDVTADMVLADLPYGTTRNTWDKALPNKLLWEQYHRLTKQRAAVVCFGSGSFSARFMVDNLAEYRYSLVWDKQTVTGHLNANRQPLRSHEDLMVFYRAQPTYNPQKTPGEAPHSRGSTRERTINHWGSFDNTEVPEYEGEYLQHPRSVWSYKRPKDGFNETQKPVDLCEALIRSYTDPGELVLDNAAGSGTTLLAARNIGRRAIGIEIRESQAEIAVKRLQAGKLF